MKRVVCVFVRARVCVRERGGGGKREMYMNYMNYTLHSAFTNVGRAIVLRHAATRPGLDSV